MVATADSYRYASVVSKHDEEPVHSVGDCSKAHGYHAADTHRAWRLSVHRSLPPADNTTAEQVAEHYAKVSPFPMSCPVGVDDLLVLAY